MVAKDRERLAISTGIALAGYAVIFLLLTGLHWPPAVPLRTIPTPVSVYVNLEGTSSEAATTTKVEPKAVEQPPPVPAKIAQNQPKEKGTAGKGVVVSPSGSTEAPVPEGKTESPAAPRSTQTAPVAPSPYSSLPSSLTSTSRPTTSRAAAPESSPSTSSSVSSEQAATGSGVANSMVSTSGRTAVGTASTSQPSGPATGPTSTRPGVSYPPGGQPAPGPPAGSGGAGSQQQGAAQTFYGPTASTTGGFFNPELAAAAGVANSAPSGNGATTGGGSPAGGDTGVAGEASTGAGRSGSAAAAASNRQRQAAGPKIEWKGDSTAREVIFQPKPLVIPARYLSEIPPTITMQIAFNVTPLGSVNALHIAPSLGYPELDNMLEAWMEEWRFQPVSGNQTAQGTLQYVIQAVTAR